MKYVDMATYQHYVVPVKTRATPKRPGRPRVSPLPRAEQLRRAKRAQRERDRKAGFVLCQFKLKAPIAKLLRRGLSIHGFDAELGEFLRDAIIDVRDYPNLELLCWNRALRFLVGWDAFRLYENYWRFVDTKNLCDSERSLIERLTAKYGNGVLNVPGQGLASASQH